MTVLAQPVGFWLCSRRCDNYDIPGDMDAPGSEEVTCNKV